MMLPQQPQSLTIFCTAQRSESANCGEIACYALANPPNQVDGASRSYNPTVFTGVFRQDGPHLLQVLNRNSRQQG